VFEQGHRGIVQGHAGKRGRRHCSANPHADCGRSSVCPHCNLCCGRRRRALQASGRPPGKGPAGFDAGRHPEAGGSSEASPTTTTKHGLAQRIGLKHRSSIVPMRCSNR
jgi:hypothetical protein